MKSKKNKRLMMGLLWGGAILSANVVGIGVLVLLSESDDVAQFDTAAGTPGPGSPRAQDGPFELSLPSQTIMVRTSKSSRAVNYVNVHLVIDDVSNRDFVCNRLPKINDVLSVSFGSKKFAEANSNALSAERMAAVIRRRINRALKRDYIKDVTFSFGFQSFKVAEGCEGSAKKARR